MARHVATVTRRGHVRTVRTDGMEMIIMCELCHMPGVTLVTPNGERCPDASGCLTRMTQNLVRREPARMPAAA